MLTVEIPHAYGADVFEGLSLFYLKRSAIKYSNIALRAGTEDLQINPTFHWMRHLAHCRRGIVRPHMLWNVCFSSSPPLDIVLCSVASTPQASIDGEHFRAILHQSAQRMSPVFWFTKNYFLNLGLTSLLIQTEPLLAYYFPGMDLAKKVNIKCYLCPLILTLGLRLCLVWKTTRHLSKQLELLLL